MAERGLAGSSSRRSSAVPVLGSLPGRVIIAGVAVKLLVSLFRLASGGTSTLVGIVDTMAGFAIAAGAFYFLFQLFVLVKRRLLWRVRRKLILSYIFIGFVPAILIVTFFLLFVLLLFFNFSSYLVQTEVRTVEDRARFLAASAALEIQRGGGRDVNGILAQRRDSVSPQHSDASLAVIAIEKNCAAQGAGIRPQGSTTSTFRLQPSTFRAGPWAHEDPPATVPDWIGCEGFTGVLPYSPQNAPEGESRTELVVRAVSFPAASNPGYAVIVDLPVNEDVKARWREETGVDLTSVSALNLGNGSGTTGGVTITGPLTWVTFLDSRDWESGQAGTLLTTTQLSLQLIYERMAAAQGLIGNRSFGQALLLVLLIVVGGLFFIIEVVAFVVGLTLARSITGSVHELFAGTERVLQGDFTHKIAVKAEDQLGELAGSFNLMTGSIEGLLRQKAEKERLEEELRIAHEIQMSLLPQGPLTMPGLSVAALCVPAREVGGDYYDFLPIDDHRVGLLIADVSGKGTSAALYMAELKGLVLSLSRIYTSPREMLITANHIISEHLDGRSFITMTYAVIDMSARTMTYARAGHTPLIHVPGGGNGSRTARILAPDGLVVGLKLDNGELFERLLQEETLPLGAGDLYVFFTDGISEAMNAADDCFGEVRLGHFVERHADLPSEELRERVLREIQAFVGGAAQHDDMTMILLKIDDHRVPAGVGPGTARAAELE